MQKKQQQRSYWQPRYWLIWLGLGILRGLIMLPWRWQMKIGKGLGKLMYHLLKRRRRIACINLALALPELSKNERKALNRAHFIALGQSVLETPLSWWGSTPMLAKLRHIEGWQHLQAAQAEKRGIILLSAHFTSLELGGRLLAMDESLHVVYRPHQNPLLDDLVARVRERRYGKAISRDDIRSMVRSLKQGQMVWYAQDQNFGHKNSVFSPFFDVLAATNTGLSRLAKLGNALVVPFFTLRQADGYQLIFLPALVDFPSSDQQADADRVNHLLEQQIRQALPQYLWTHRRFKDCPEGGNRYTQQNDKRQGC
ncbi:MAG TPA: LpxL/LpxP family Kdo(2)-lipid IV(A) lauroyl/palmitoleoyl acyltransferase [Thiothrix sp.]|nr:LpxL/LpxP family Kdo(2)-lipid IV(A) lauroyl/palmitoleoyl acyltransferase [Thiothrix sp.]